MPLRKAALADMHYTHNKGAPPGSITELSLQTLRMDINDCSSQGSRFFNSHKNFLVALGNELLVTRSIQDKGG